MPKIADPFPIHAATTLALDLKLTMPSQLVHPADLRRSLCPIRDLAHNLQFELPAKGLAWHKRLLADDQWLCSLFGEATLNWWYGAWGAVQMASSCLPTQMVSWGLLLRVLQRGQVVAVQHGAASRWSHVFK